MDALNLKAALFAIQTLFDEGERQVPLMVSLLSDQAGGNFPAPSLEAMWNTARHAPADGNWSELFARTEGDASLCRGAVAPRLGPVDPLSERRTA
jgi:hypothetical protein